MSIQVYIGHSGQRFSLDPNEASTVEALRSWVAQKAYIQPRNQILLSPLGKLVRAQTLLTESELFVFDSTRLTTESTAVPLDPSDNSSKLDDYDPGTPPAITNQSDLAAWQNLFRVRKSWAGAVVNGCDSRAKQAERYRDEQAIIERSLGVAVASLQDHVRSAERKYAAAEVWLDDVVQSRDIGEWEHHLASLRNVPARAEFSGFLQPAAPGTRRPPLGTHRTTLQDFVNVPSIRQAALTAKAYGESSVNRLNKVRSDLDVVTKQGDDLLRLVEEMDRHSPSLANSEPAQLMGEILTVAKKLAVDLETVQAMPRTAQSCTQASKMASLHSRNHLPNVVGYCDEMNEFVRRTRQTRDSAAHVAAEHMQTLSGIESQLSGLYQDIKSIEIPQDAQDAYTVVDIMTRLPSVYGQLLVESVRRREWVAKMKRDCSTLQEEVATYQEEENKRRRKWMRSVEDVIDLENLEGNVLGIELGLVNEGGSWPMVTREELQDYLAVLLNLYGVGPVSDEMEQAIKDLDKPTRKQIKHAKAFKNGSMHEAAFGDTSLLLRGDEQYRALREANIRLDEELKGQRSRVRKLEDLLHRQSQSSRVPHGDTSTPQSGTPPSMSAPPGSEDLSRNSSIRHRRLSSAQQIEEKRLARRVVDLEGEIQMLRDEAATRRTSDAEAQKQVEEAVSTKKDLMENMDAQQREFAEERRNLERELAEAKEKIEELENEIERIIGSRDEERTGLDTKLTALEGDVCRHKEESEGRVAELEQERKAVNDLQSRLDQAKLVATRAHEEIARLRTELEQFQKPDSEYVQSLVTAHEHLAPGGEIPSNVDSLPPALKELSRKAAVYAKDLADAVAFSKSENESLWASNERQKLELSNAKEKHSGLEQTVWQTEETLAAECAKVKSLEEQLAQEQCQLRNLRNQFAEGESGSGMLRQRIADEETRAHRLSEELAGAKSHIDRLHTELIRLQKTQAASSSGIDASSHLRAERAKELSQRLYVQNGRLMRLLDRLGFVVTYQDETMAVERASKLSASVTNMTDPQALNRTTSWTTPSPKRRVSASEDQPELSMLRWPDASTPADETKQFDFFMQHLARFNIDTFSDAIVKRVRDFEYTARKYNKESKESTKRADGYKERAAKLTREAHAKIAVRDFKEGDLALFLPTRGQAKGAWAAFNIGCPHYFLAEREGMRLGSRDFIVARISKIERKVVDLSKSNITQPDDNHSVDEGRDIQSNDDNDNPFDLSDGLTWWMVHASEERGAGAPSTPGLGKSTVAAANVDATGSIRIKRGGSRLDNASKHLNKSLDSRRSSSTSAKKGAVGPSNAFAHSPTASTFADASRPRSGGQPPQTSLTQSSTIPLQSSGLGNASSANPDPDVPTSPKNAAHRPALQAEQTEQAEQAAAPEQILSARSKPSIPLQEDQDHQHQQALQPFVRPQPQQRDRHDHTLQAVTTPPSPRDQSPSKSARSVHRHLGTVASSSAQETATAAMLRSTSSLRSPAKSPVRNVGDRPEADKAVGKERKGAAGGWESIFDFSVESSSPSKG